MTEPLTQYDPALAAALDRFAPPPLSVGFADRLEAAHASRTPTSLPVPRRRGRGAWTRGRHVLMGAVAFGLVSAAAAATGVFGPITRNTPVIGPIMASVAPSIMARADPGPKPVRKARPVHVAKAAPAPAPSPTLAETAAPVANPAIEDRAQRIAARLDRRAERRAALGLPPKPMARKKLRQALKSMPPEERRATILRLRELRRQRLASDPDLQARIARRAERRAAIMGMSPDERQALRAERRARREAIAPLTPSTPQ